MCMHEGMCGCSHHKLVPLFITLIGLSFLLQAMGVLSAMIVAYAWPILLTLIGLQKMMGGMCKCCGGGMMGMHGHEHGDHDCEGCGEVHDHEHSEMKK